MKPPRWPPNTIKLTWNGNDLMELILDIRDLANARKWRVNGANKKSLFADLAEIGALADAIFHNKTKTIDEIREQCHLEREKYEN